MACCGTTGPPGRSISSTSSTRSEQAVELTSCCNVNTSLMFGLPSSCLTSVSHRCFHCPMTLLKSSCLTTVVSYWCFHMSYVPASIILSKVSTSPLLLLSNDLASICLVSLPPSSCLTSVSYRRFRFLMSLLKSSCLTSVFHRCFNV